MQHESVQHLLGYCLLLSTGTLLIDEARVGYIDPETLHDQAFH